METRKEKYQIQEFVKQELAARKRKAGWKSLSAGSLEDLRAEVEMLKDLRDELNKNHRAQDVGKALYLVQHKIERKLIQIAKIEIKVIEKLDSTIS